MAKSTSVLLAATALVLLCSCSKQAATEEEAQYKPAADLLDGRYRIHKGWQLPNGPLVLAAVQKADYQPDEKVFLEIDPESAGCRVLYRVPGSSDANFAIASPIEPNLIVIGTSEALVVQNHGDDTVVASGGDFRCPVVAPSGVHMLVCGPNANRVALVTFREGGAVDVSTVEVALQDETKPPICQWVSESEFIIVDAAVGTLVAFDVDHSGVAKRVREQFLDVPAPILAYRTAGHDIARDGDPGDFIGVVDERPVYFDETGVWLGSELLHGWSDAEPILFGTCFAVVVGRRIFIRDGLGRMLLVGPSGVAAESSNSNLGYPLEGIWMGDERVFTESSPALLRVRTVNGALVGEEILRLDDL